MDTIVADSRLDFIVIGTAAGNVGGKLLIAVGTVGPNNTVAPNGINIDVLAGGNQNGGNKVGGFIGGCPA